VFYRKALSSLPPHASRIVSAIAMPSTLAPAAIRTAVLYSRRNVEQGSRPDRQVMAARHPCV